ncbi:MAG: hypothetical protein ACJAVX_000711 [Pseudoalteromonas rhizosphaerae]|jgi:hypothetical protein
MIVLIEKCLLNLVITYLSVKVLEVIYSLKIVGVILATYSKARKGYELIL